MDWITTKLECVRRWQTKILIVLLAIQFAFLCYINLFRNAAMNDYDASGAYVHILEINKQHTLFPEGYGYATTMDVDSTVGLAAILLNVTHNIFVAQGICNIFVILLYLFVIREIFLTVGADKRAMLFTMILFFIPYSRGMVGFWNVQYVSVAANTIRNFIPLLYVSVLLDLRYHRYGIRCILKCIASLGLMLLTSISASFYVMVFGIFSLILCDVFIYIKNGNAAAIKDPRWGMHLLMVAMCLAGMKIQSGMGVAAKVSGQEIIPFAWGPTNTAAWFYAIFDLFGALPMFPGTKLFSIAGIEMALKYGITLFFLGSLLYFLFRFLSEHNAPDHILYVIFIAAVDALALNYLNTTYGSVSYENRYHIMPILFVMVGGGFFLDKVFTSENPLMREIPLWMGILFLCATMGISDYVSLKYVQIEDNSAKLETLNDYMEEADVDTAIVCSPMFSQSARSLRAYGDNVDYVIFDVTGNAPDYAWGGSSRVSTLNGKTGKTAVITTAAEVSMISDAYLSQMEYLGQASDMEIYLVPEGVFPL